MKRKSKVISLILLLILALLTAIAAGTSVSRYVFREQDQITGSFTNLYFSHDGQGRVVLMEKDTSGGTYTGYFTFTANNYEGDNVTPRDIKYKLRLPTKDELESGAITDAWGTEQSLRDGADGQTIITNTGKYNLTYYESGVTDSTIAAVPDGENFWPSSNRDTFTLKRTESGNEDKFESETIYLIAEITYPYQELHLFTVNTSTNLLTVSATPVREPETHFSYTQYWVNVQTARSFDNAVDGVYTDSPVKVVLTWTANAPVIFDSGRFAAATDGNMVYWKPYGDREQWGEYRWYAESDSGNGSYTNTVTLYLPQGSDARLYFYVYGQNSFSLKAEAWFQMATGEEGSYSYGATKYTNIAGPDEKGIVIQDGTLAGN